MADRQLFDFVSLALTDTPLKKIQAQTQEQEHEQEQHQGKERELDLAPSLGGDKLWKDLLGGPEVKRAVEVSLGKDEYQGSAKIDLTNI